METATNESLLLKYQQADMESFELFYLRNRSLVMAFLVAKVGNRQDAEEIFQETFMRIHRSILSYDPNKSALAWTLGIAKNAAIDLLRKKNANKTIPLESDPPHNVSRTDVALEASQALNNLLSSLRDEELLLIQSRYVEGRSYAQIAADLSLQETGVRKRVSRMIKSLKVKYTSF